MSDESFLSRWSRLKRTETQRRPEAEAAPAEPVPVAPLQAEPVQPVPGEPELPAAVPPADGAAEPVPEDLPPVESLTGESDFTPFLRADVPEDLHRQALRKLWSSDPVYANDDGLKDYADDYTGLFNGGPVKTLYRVGKGFLDAVEEAAEKAEQMAADAPAPADEQSTVKADTADNSTQSGDVTDQS